MTPEERQLLSALADRVKSAPAQQKDPEAEQFLLQLVQEQPDTPYILAQTVIMQDFALRNAQARIEELQRQLQQGPAQAQQGTGSFLGGMFRGSPPQTGSVPPAGSVPRVDPWERYEQRQAPPAYSPPPQPGYGYTPGGPTMQPSQTSGFLRNAAATATGVAGGALLFQGIQSLFSGHHSSLLGGWNPSTANPNESLSETTVVNNYYDDQPRGGDKDLQYADYQPDQSTDAGYEEADYDPGDDSDFGGGDDSYNV